MHMCLQDLTLATFASELVYRSLECADANDLQAAADALADRLGVEIGSVQVAHHVSGAQRWVLPPPGGPPSAAAGSFGRMRLPRITADSRLAWLA